MGAYCTVLYTVIPTAQPVPLCQLCITINKQPFVYSPPASASAPFRTAAAAGAQVSRMCCQSTFGDALWRPPSAMWRATRRESCCVVTMTAGAAARPSSRTATARLLTSKPWRRASARAKTPGPIPTMSSWGQVSQMFFHFSPLQCSLSPLCCGWLFICVFVCLFVLRIKAVCRPGADSEHLTFLGALLWPVVDNSHLAQFYLHHSEIRLLFFVFFT